jgi:hypothetical protein
MIYHAGRRVIPPDHEPMEEFCEDWTCLYRIQARFTTNFSNAEAVYPNLSRLGRPVEVVS